MTAKLAQRRTTELLTLGRSAGTVAGLAIFFTLNNVLFISAIKVTTIANAVLTHYLAPVFVVLLEYRNQGEGQQRVLCSGTSPVAQRACGHPVADRNEFRE